MRRAIVLLSVAACLALVVGCSNPAMDIEEYQPIYFCDPEMTVELIYDGTLAGLNPTYYVTVDANVTSLYPGLLDEVDLEFTYSFGAETLNIDSPGSVAWAFSSGPMDPNTDPSVWNGEFERTNQSHTYVALLELDPSGIGAGETVQTVVNCRVTARYGPDDGDLGESIQEYDLFVIVTDSLTL